MRMRERFARLSAWVAMLAAVPLANAAWATEASYAGWNGRPIKALSAEQIDDLRHGRGMGLALAAELNGYPGPRHVLDLADQLDLSIDERAEIQKLFDEMQAQAIVLGGQVIAAEAALDRLFLEQAASDAAIQTAAIELGKLQGALRGHHLRYHLTTRDLLSLHQIARYQELRGYAADGHHGHAPGGMDGSHEHR